MKYENLQLLLDEFKLDLAEIGYFELAYSKVNINLKKVRRLP